jgi:excisionase family DNA binding protein
MVRRKKVSTVQPVLLSVSDVAIQLGVCRNTVYKLMKCDSLPSVMLGGVRRVHPTSLQDWLKQREQEIA